MREWSSTFSDCNDHFLKPAKCITSALSFELFYLMYALCDSSCDNSYAMHFQMNTIRGKFFLTTWDHCLCKDLGLVSVSFCLTPPRKFFCSSCSCRKHWKINQQVPQWLSIFSTKVTYRKYTIMAISPNSSIHFHLENESSFTYNLVY